MGTIYIRKTSNGKIKYYASIYHKGKRIRKYLGDSKKIATSNFKKIEYEILFNKYKTTSFKVITLNKAIISFIRYLSTTSTSQRQIKTIQSKIRMFFKYSDVSLEEINKQICNDYIFYRSKQNIKTITLIKEIGFIRRFFNYCVHMEWLKKNPFNTIKIKNKVVLKPRFFFNKKQVKMILSNSKEYYEFYIFLLETGLRPTDAFKLKSEHFSNGYLTIKMNKTGDYLNQIPISKKAITIINKRLNNKGILFPEIKSLYKRKKCLKLIQNNFDKEYVKNKNINLHTFRHTFANNMLNKGVPKEVLQTLLGHRSIKTTEIYANFICKKELKKWV